MLVLAPACSEKAFEQAEIKGSNAEHESLASFYKRYGGKSTFPEEEILALESLIFAQEDLEAGRLKEHKKLRSR